MNKGAIVSVLDEALQEIAQRLQVFDLIEDTNKDIIAVAALLKGRGQLVTLQRKSGGVPLRLLLYAGSEPQEAYQWAAEVRDSLDFLEGAQFYLLFLVPCSQAVSWIREADQRFCPRYARTEYETVSDFLDRAFPRALPAYRGVSGPELFVPGLKAPLEQVVLLTGWCKSTLLRQMIQDQDPHGDLWFHEELRMNLLRQVLNKSSNLSDSELGVQQVINRIDSPRSTLFLDGCLDGMSLSAAFRLIRLLVEVAAQQGRRVVLTIREPMVLRYTCRMFRAAGVGCTSFTMHPQDNCTTRFVPEGD